MPLNNSGRNALGTSGKAGITHIAALTALTPTEHGTRQAITWQAMGTPAAGQAGNSAIITIAIAVDITILALGLYDAAAAGNHLGNVPYGSAGQVVKGVGSIDAIATDLIQSNGHGLTTDHRVWFSTVNGEAIPTGITADTVLYFVLAAGLTADAFKVSTTSGGAALDITGLGELAFWRTVPNTFNSAGNLTIAVNALLLDLTMV